MKNTKNLKVVCAMSGGVDSSVSAALLKEVGFDVVGVFMKFWAGDGLGKQYNRCCSDEAEKRARKVASVLDIPFYAVDFKRDFKKKIVEPFLSGYRRGDTPNPCIACNREIKFGLLFEKARELGADFVATGHYVMAKETERGIGLFKSRDRHKDQSYFLWKLRQSQLARVLFPVGGYRKPEVRALARHFKLSVHDAPDSQEVCFIPKTTSEFLKKYLKVKPGRIVDAEGRAVGEHKGLWFYTIGQRKGINLPQGPFYVAEKNSRKNELVVTKNRKDLYRKELVLKSVNWISGKSPRLPLKVKARIRYGAKESKAVVLKSGKRCVIKFENPQRAPASGQSAVFYIKNRMVGGGIIC